MNKLQDVCKKALVIPVLASLFFGGVSMSYASAVNPYSHVKTITLSGDKEAAYIEEKATKIFNPAKTSRPAVTEYVVPEGWQRQVLSLKNVPVEKYTYTKKAADRVVFFLHGGGYVGPLHNRYRDWGVHLAELAGNATMYATDYRIAPKFKYPAALEDAAAAYEGMLAEGVQPENVILMGDSAGGNLAAALAVYLRDHKIPQPKAIVLISPWTDMGNSMPSRTLNFEKDQILGAKNKRLAPEIAAPSYVKGVDTSDPYVSPARADLTGLAPMLITAGGNELLLDDAVLLAAHARSAGVAVQETIYPGMSHDWTILFPELKASKAMNEEIKTFINGQMKK